MNVLAVIPARGGSKGIPHKNIKLLHGHPLIYYIITCARRCNCEMDIVVSSDDDKILEIAAENGSLTLKRPEEFSGDDVTLDPVIFHAVEAMESMQKKAYDIVITLQPTAPLLSAETLSGAIAAFIKGDADTLISAVNDPHLSWREENGQIVPNYKERLNRQYLPKEWRETGAFVISKRENVCLNSRFGENISIYEIPEDEAVDIDTMQDFYVCEYQLQEIKE